MPFCSFSEGAAMFDVTPIENMFLLEYLPTAPDGYLRVYLYARMLCLHPELGGELKDMAKALHMEEEAVFNAFSYWERMGLVERLSDRPPTYAMRPLKGGGEVQTEMDRDYYKYREFNSSLQALFPPGEMLQPNQYQMANDWLNVLGFSQEAALRMLEYEIHQPGGKRAAAVFKRANKRAAEWADRGIRSLEDVNKAIAYDDQVYALASTVMKQFAMNRRPTVNELDCVRRWIEDWKLTEQDVIDACAQTTKSRAPSFGYLDAILKARVESGSNDHFEAVKEVLRELGASNTVPTPDQTRKYAALLEQGFDKEALMLAAVQCARKRKHSFEDLEWMAEEWGKAGVRSRADAEKYISDMQQATREVRSLLETAGLSRRPNMDDLARYASWRTRFSPELIQCAAECARSRKVPMIYMDKLLSAWEKSGATTPEAARAQHAQVTGAERPAVRTAAPQAQNYQQHSYTEADYGADFYYDPAKDYGDSARNDGQEGDAQ